MTTPLAAPRVSPLDAVTEAIEHTRRMLFPFRFERWLTLGFLAFLDQCGRGGGVNLPSAPGGFGGSGGGQPDTTAFTSWIASHVGLIVVIAAGALTVIVLLSALILWLNSRGIFMYMDAVATGRADVARPWREHAERAHSFFAWRFGLAMAALVGVLAMFAFGALAFLGYSRGQIDGMTMGITAVLILLPAFLVLLLAAALAALLLRDVVAPLQWRFGLSSSDAIRRALALVRAHAGAFGLYVALKLAFGLLLSFVVILAGCLTCCLAWLPVVSQTLLQPIFFFERAWSLCFLRQMGCDVFGRALEPPAAQTPG